jgi:ComF family protein
MRALLDVVAPIRCVHCGAAADGELCPACARDVTVLTPPLCDRCGAPLPEPSPDCADCRDLEGFGRARSLVVFAEPARELTLALKRRGRPALARSVGELLAELVGAHRLATPDAVVTFVPGSRRARVRGFDHAELIAAAVARALGSPKRRLLVRASDGPRQADVPFMQRRANVRERFGAYPTGVSVLLVDDVFTTGATVEACSKALRTAGARSVNVVTWARTLRRRARYGI